MRKEVLALLGEVDCDGAWGGHFGSKVIGMACGGQGKLCVCERA